MKRSLFKTMEDLLKDYPMLDTKIEQIEEEIRYPYRESDENVGGGKGNARSEPQLATLILIDDDNRLKAFRNQRKVIDECLDECDPDTYTLIESMYFTQRYTLEQLVDRHIVNLSRAQAFRVRKNFIENMAHRFGWYELEC